MSKNRGPTWTGPKEARLTELWLDGVPARLIGIELKTTKSSVVSKRKRLGLPGRGSPIRYDGRNPTTKKVLVGATVQSEPVQPVAPPPEEAAAVHRRLKISQAQSRAEQNIRRDNGQGLLPWAINRQFLSVAGLRFRECQWPIGDPREPDFHFCNAAVSASRLYCPGHEALAYRKPQASEIKA